MPAFFPQALIRIASVPETDGFQRSPLVCWSTPAGAWNQESGTEVHGRFNEALGEARGAPVPKAQDTYISGTGSRTGRAFTVVSGTWKDDFYFHEFGKYGLMMPDGTSGTTFEVKDANAPVSTKGITHNLVIVRRG